MKRVFYLTFIIFSFILFSVSQSIASFNQVKPITSPMKDKDIVKNISLLEYESLESFFEAADTYNINLLFTHQESDEDITYVRWRINDTSYFENIPGLSGDISPSVLKSIEFPISTNEDNPIFIKISKRNIDVSWSYLDESKLGSSFVLKAFTDNPLDMNAFIRDISSDASIVVGVSDYLGSLNLNYLSFLILDTSNMTMFPLLLIVSVLSIMINFLNDKRNLSIFLLNGESKASYIKVQLKLIIPKIIVSSIVVFILSYLFLYRLDFTHLQFMVVPYFVLSVISILFYILVIFILVFSFNDVTHISYIKGHKNRGLTNYFVSLVRMVFVVYLSVLLVRVSINYLIIKDEQKGLENHLQYHEGVHIISLQNFVLDKSIAFSETIVDQIENEVSAEVFRKGSDIEILPIVISNDHYAKRQNISIEGKPISNYDVSGKVFVKKTNYEDAQITLDDDSTYCIEHDIECSNLDFIIIDNDSTITPYDIGSVSYDLEGLSHNFVLIVPNQKFHILDYHFYFRDNKSIERTTKLLSDAFNENIELESLEMQAMEAIEANQMNLMRRSLQALNYLIGLYLVTLLFYKTEFSHRIRELSIKRVNGENIMTLFIPFALYQLVVSWMILIIIKNFWFTWVNWLVVVLIGAVYLVIDVSIINFSLYQFRKRIMKELKGI